MSICTCMYGCRIFQKDKKYINIFHSKVLHNILVVLVCKVTIWQPCSGTDRRQSDQIPLKCQPDGEISSARLNHRNLVLERACLRWSSKHFWRKKPCKKSADLLPRQGNLLQRNILQASTKPLLQHKIGWRPAEKGLAEKIPFFKMLLLVQRFLCTRSFQLKTQVVVNCGQTKFLKFKHLVQAYLAVVLRFLYLPM
jgi:hypothetical protein